MAVIDDKLNSEVKQLVEMSSGPTRHPEQTKW